MDIYSFKGAIFDLDGTLIDSAHIWNEIDERFLGKRGIPVPEDYAKTVSAMNFYDAAVYTRNRFGLTETPEDMVREWHEAALYEYAHNIKAKPHAAELLQSLKGAGIKLALATASHKVLYSAVLKNNGIYDCFDVFASTDEVKRGKGFPDIYELAARRMELMPWDCVVFEDIIEGVQAAKAGGFAAVAFLNGCFPADDERMRIEADLCITDYSEIRR